MIKPPRLQKGDRVAAISVSSGNASLLRHRYEIGIRQAKSTLGIDIEATPHAFESYQFLHDNPQARADDLMQAFADPDIKAVICITGGSDAILTTRHLQSDVFINNPKIFLGYSDATHIHFYLNSLGIHSFYGPAVLTDLAENTGISSYTESSLKKVLFQHGPAGPVANNREGWTTEFLDWFKIENQSIKRRLNSPDGPLCLQGNGRVRGRLVGGCVESLEMLKATPLWPQKEKWDGAILFLETSELGMPASSFVKCLRNYGMQGIFDRISGLLFGRPGGNMLKVEDFAAYDAGIMQVIGQEFGRPDLPVLSRMDFGHTAPIMTLPYGVEAEIDCEAKTLSLLDTAVN